MSADIGAVLLAAVCVFAALFFWLGWKDGYTRGYNTGWQQGRKDEQDWWAEQGRAVDQDWEKIWREELNHVAPNRDAGTSDPTATL